MALFGAKPSGGLFGPSTGASSESWTLLMTGMNETTSWTLLNYNPSKVWEAPSMSNVTPRVDSLPPGLFGGNKRRRFYVIRNDFTAGINVGGNTPTGGMRNEIHINVSEDARNFVITNRTVYTLVSDNTGPSFGGLFGSVPNPWKIEHNGLVMGTDTKPLEIQLEGTQFHVRFTLIGPNNSLFGSSPGSGGGSYPIPRRMGLFEQAISHGTIHSIETLGRRVTEL